MDYGNGKATGDGQTSHRKPGGQPENRNARKNGAYAERFVTDQERQAFKDLRTELAEDLQEETGADSLELDMVCLLALRHGQALQKGEVDTALKLDPMIRNHLTNLKATRASKKTLDKPGQLKTGPADWAAALLKKQSDNKNPPSSDSEKTQE